MKRKCILVTLLIFVMLLSGCGKSNYEMLSSSEKAIVNQVLDKMPDCDGIRFAIFNGETYFVASYSDKDFSNVVTHRYFKVSENNFVEDTYNFYTMQTSYGITYQWDKTWNQEQKRETLAKAIKEAN